MRAATSMRSAVSTHVVAARRGQSPPRARPGVALIMAVVAMAVLGALVAGSFFAALREQRDGRDAIHRVQALATAEYGLAVALAPNRWPSPWKLTARRGSISQLAFDLDTGTTDTVRVWKLDRNSFLLASTGRAGNSGSRAMRRVALLVALRIPRLRLRSAAVASLGVTIADSSSISGIDTVQVGWDCPPADGDRPGVIVAEPALLDVGGCTSTSCIDGAPSLSLDSLAGGADSYERMGDMERDSIADAALQLSVNSVISAPAPRIDGAGECDVARLDNLGDPLRILGATSPCADHFPVLHAPGNMRIEGGEGQGMLLVDGNLTLASGAHFRGVVAVKGVLEITESSELHGAALASRVVVHGESVLRYSSCAVTRALRAAAMPVVAEGPAWSNQY